MFQGLDCTFLLVDHFLWNSTIAVKVVYQTIVVAADPRPVFHPPELSFQLLFAAVYSSRQDSRPAPHLLLNCRFTMFPKVSKDPTPSPPSTPETTNPITLTDLYAHLFHNARSSTPSPTIHIPPTSTRAKSPPSSPSSYATTIQPSCYPSPTPAPRKRNAMVPLPTDLPKGLPQKRPTNLRTRPRLLNFLMHHPSQWS